MSSKKLCSRHQSFHHTFSSSNSVLEGFQGMHFTLSDVSSVISLQPPSHRHPLPKLALISTPACQNTQNHLSGLREFSNPYSDAAGGRSDECHRLRLETRLLGEFALLVLSGLSMDKLQQMGSNYNTKKH